MRARGHDRDWCRCPACCSLRYTPRSNASVARLDVIDVGQHESAVEQLECVLQVLRNSGTAEPSCPESFMALAEHVSIFAWCRTPTSRR